MASNLDRQESGIPQNKYRTLLLYETAQCPQRDDCFMYLVVEG